MDCLAIGSLPYDDPEKAMQIVEKYFPNIPFWAQLTKKDEDMTFQFLEGMPSFFLSNDSTFSFDTENEKFFDDSEKFFNDYKEIIINNNKNLLENYKISDEFSSTFKPFIEFIKKNKCKYAKGQIIGPFTLSTTLTDKNGRCSIYDSTLREIIIKTLSLKALWQIEHIKKAGAIPIIFIDEPSLSQFGTSAFITISDYDAISMIKEISDIIKNNGGISAIHCCGKCDWDIPVKTNVDIISVDAYDYAKNLSLYHKSIQLFLENGGKIAWGIVPTLNKTALEKTDLEILDEKFKKSVNYLTKKGINEKLIMDNSIITPSCGAGALSEKLTEKAMMLTYELAKRYNETCNYR